MDTDLDISPEDSPIRKEDNPTAGPSQEAENKEPEEPEEKSAAISNNTLAAHYAH